MSGSSMVIRTALPFTLSDFRCAMAPSRAGPFARRSFCNGSSVAARAAARHIGRPPMCRAGVYREGISKDKGGPTLLRRHPCGFRDRLDLGGAILEFGDFAEGVERRIGEQVRRRFHER